MNGVTITVSGRVGSGKSALCGEIEILCKALGLQVEWIGGQQEKNLTGADWIHEIELYKPSVRIIERIDTASPTSPECERLTNQTLATVYWLAMENPTNVNRFIAEARSLLATRTGSDK